MFRATIRDLDVCVKVCERLLPYSPGNNYLLAALNEASQAVDFLRQARGVWREGVGVG
jgi:hypothetical protein